MLRDLKQPNIPGTYEGVPNYYNSRVKVPQAGGGFPDLLADHGVLAANEKSPVPSIK